MQRPILAARYLLQTLGYATVVNASYLTALLLRFDGNVPQVYWDGFARVAPVFTAMSLAGYLASGLYRGVWRYASTVTLFQVVKGVSLSAVSLGLVALFTVEPLFPRSEIALVWLLQLVLLGGLRFGWGLSGERLLGPAPRRTVRALVIGADHAGVHLIREMRRAAGPERLIPIGFMDDERRLAGQVVEGVPVLGTIADLKRVLVERRIEMVVISDSNLPGKAVREVAGLCAQAQVRVKTLPGLSDLQHGRPSLAQMRDVRIEDLLGRQPVEMDSEQMREFLRGQRVLVTGAGGSIGSELARQIADIGPAELVLLDHAENGLYFVHNELAALHPELALHPVVGDIKDVEGVERTFTRFEPQVVFHAAAHKHVPLLEGNACEAVLNNVVGTRNLMHAADRVGVDKFVLLSTDKAVNPTSVMGASKRACEILLQSHARNSRTCYVAVRFGNVLGSEGSVIPLFQRQIERGGPITVTHPEARRYFMTVREAVRLVLHAGAIGRTGEVLLLDMGEQVRIVDLARQLIRMAGLREGEDVSIVFTGLRPGEKLREELQSDAERMRMTRYERILVWDLESQDEPAVIAEVAELAELARRGEPEAVRRQLRVLVPEYSEARDDSLEPAPATAPEPPAIELPDVSASPEPAARPWRRTPRQVIEAVVAAGLLAASTPLVAALWVESRLRRGRFLVRETRIGCSQRRDERRRDNAPVAIDRRSGEQRTRELPGQALVCARFGDTGGPLGRWAARHGLETLPWLLNVLRFEMALVGPRPETEEWILRWRHLQPDYERRFGVLPGMTGLAQVSGYREAAPHDVARRIQYDLYYVDHRSLLLDLRTVARTLLWAVSGSTPTATSLGPPDSAPA